MHFGVYEFEVFQDEGCFVAIPYDLEGATQGEDFADLCLMVADWLKVHLESWEVTGTEPPEPTFGNKPRWQQAAPWRHQHDFRRLGGPGDHREGDRL